MSRVNVFVACLAWLVIVAPAMAEPTGGAAGPIDFPQVSPDGRTISFARGNGVLYLAPSDDPDAVRAVRGSQPTLGPSIFGMDSGPYAWAYTNRHILFLRDQAGEEDYVVYSLDLDTGKIIPLTPTKGVRAQLLQLSPKHPDEVLLMHDGRDVKEHGRKLGRADVYRVNIRTGQSTMVLENDRFASFFEEVRSFLVDDDLQIRVALRGADDGGFALDTPDGKGGWRTIYTLPMALSDTLRLYGVDRNGLAYVSLSDAQDRHDARKIAGLVSIDLATGEVRKIYKNDRADVVDALLSPVDGRPQAAFSYYTRADWAPLTPGIARNFRALKTRADGDIKVLSRSLDDRVWLVRESSDVAAPRYFLIDGASGQVRPLPTAPAKAQGEGQRARTTPVVIKSRDGYDMVSYLTLPKGVSTPDGIHPDKPVPLILWVHGGPWDRDRWSDKAMHQFYAEQGYATLSVNFRGSLGFGATYVEAAIGEWGRNMHNDLLDGVIWAIQEGIAQPDKVGISGSSYGGYSTLTGMTFTPDVFACGAAIAAPADLVHFMESLPAYWNADYLRKAIGDPTTEAGRRQLRSVSALFHADQISRPLFLAHGVNDPRVPESEIAQLAKTLEARNHPVTYLRFPDEGHDIARDENVAAMLTSIGVFFDGCLGDGAKGGADRFELRGSSVEVVTGAKYLPGLEEALRRHAAAGKAAR